MHISRLAAIAASCLALGACNAVTNPVTPKGVYEMQSAYDAAFLVPASHYRQLPLCASGQAPAAANICADRKIVIALQTADRNVSIAVSQLRAFATAHPTLDASAYVAAAQTAVSTALAIVTANGIK